MARDLDAQLFDASHSDDNPSASLSDDNPSASLSDDEPTTNVTAVPAELQRQLQESAPQQTRRPSLIALVGGNVGEIYRVSPHGTVFGRSSTADVKIADESISRKHVRVFQEDRNVIVEDLGSANGTYVNTERVSGRRTLADGDKIRLGTNVVLKFTYQDTLDEQFARHMYDAALRDALTGTFNKKYLLDRLTTEIAYAKRHQTQLSLVMIDVDHFKRVNDTYGHLAGDMVLTRLTRLVTATLRAEDVFGRYGGEEFSVITRGISALQTGVLADRLRRTIETASFEHEGRRFNVTASFGIANTPECASYDSTTAIIGAADAALYEAKRAGRNRVVVAS